MWLTKLIVRSLELAGKHRPSRTPAHLRTGQRGELAACFYLRKLGYRMVAANLRAPFDQGEIDLVGWERGVLCFIEVKTRSDDSFAPPETAVDAEKRRNILAVARRYLRQLPSGKRPTCRFDVVSVVLSTAGSKPRIELHRGAFSWDSGKPRDRRREFREAGVRRWWRRGGK